LIPLLVAAITAFLLPLPAAAYPGFIGYGYNSCAACHYNPLGNGPLTDYGRAVSASAIAAKPFFVSSRTSDEELGESSGFLAGAALPDWFRPSIDYRGMDLRSKQDTHTFTRWIDMQADVNLVVRWPNDRFFVSGSVGLAPIPPQLPKAVRDSLPSLISREHYVAIRPFKWVGIYAGLMDPAYGIRIPDHNAFIRSKAFLDKNDQTHGVMAHWGFKTADIAIHAMAGNLSQKPALRQKGGSATAEFDVADNWRLGGSAWITDGSFRSRQMGAVHTRLGVGEGSSLMVQAGFVREDGITARAQLGATFFTQYLVRITRGLNFLGTVEYYTPQYFEKAIRYYRAGPGLQYFPMQRLEFRADLQGSRQVGGSTLDPDIFTLLTQVHLWL